MKTIFLLLLSTGLFSQSYELSSAVFYYRSDSISLTESQLLKLDKISPAKITIYSDSLTISSRAEDLEERTGLTIDRVYSIENKISIIFFKPRKKT